jgi:hypothetical protein
MSSDRTLVHPGLVYSVRVTTAVGAVFLACGCAALVYGLLDMFAPSLTIRWQVRSTATHGETRRAVGLGLQGALRIDPDADPWNDADVKRKVRWIGFGLSLFGLAVVILGILDAGSYLTRGATFANPRADDDGFLDAPRAPQRGRAGRWMIRWDEGLHLGDRASPGGHGLYPRAKLV